MACRCGDLEKMRHDLSILYDISRMVSVIETQDVTVGEDLLHLGNICEASFISKSGFTGHVTGLKGTATTDISALRTKVDDLIEQLNADIDAAKSEDHDYHIQQLKNFFKVG